MAINNFTYDMNIVQALSDTPNDTLTADGLKAKFDEGGLQIQQYLNQNVVPEVNKLLNFLTTSGGVTALDGSKIKDKTIGTAKIDDNAITSEKIQNGTITSSDIKQKTITGGTSGNIAEGAITSFNIDNLTITGDDIANETITHYKFATGAVVQALQYPPNDSSTASYRKKIWVTGRVPYFWDDRDGHKHWYSFVPEDGSITAAKLQPGLLGSLFRWTEKSIPADGHVLFPEGCTFQNLISVQLTGGNGSLLFSTYKTETEQDTYFYHVQAYRVGSDGKLTTDIGESMPPPAVTFCYLVV